MFNEPVALPKGTVIEMVSHHDNSAANPDQQFDPPQDIHFGEATHQEMSITFNYHTVDNEDLNVEAVLPARMITESRAREAAHLAASEEPVKSTESAGSGR